MSALAIPRISAELYLDLDRYAENKSEYLDGIMYAMAGGSFAHSFLTSRMNAQLQFALGKRRCSVSDSNMRVRASARRSYFYPDVTVTCGEPISADDDKDSLVNPTLIVEVLSKSTESFDRGEKFRQYQQMESLREYVLVSQSEPRIEVFARQPDGEWARSEYAGMDAVCRFESIDCRIPIAAVYDGIALE